MAASLTPIDTPATLPGTAAAGPMAALVGAFDWAATPLGAMAGWPVSLKSLLSTLLHSRQPMLLWWGPEQIQFYNDAFDRCFGRGLLPGGIGRRGVDCWGEMWPNMARGIGKVMQQGVATWYTDKLVPVWREGRVEDVYWTYGYSPAYDDALAVGGVLVTCTETTARVLSERRQQLLARMAAAMADAHSLPEIARNALAVANDAPGDIERALICRLDDAQGWAVHFALEPTDLAAVRDELTRRLDPARRQLRQTPDVMPGTDSRPTYARAVGPQQPGDRLCIAPVGRPPAIWDKVMVFVLNTGLPFDAAYLEFINQFLDTMMAALLRVDAAQVREAAAIERDSLLLQAPVPAALMIGPEHRYRLANAPYCEMVGRQVTGKTWREVFPELIATELPAILDRAYRTGERYTSGPTLVPLHIEGAAEATERWLLINLQPLRHSNGEVYGLMSVATDVTARVTAQREMDLIHTERRVLVEELEAANRVKDEFLAMLGHELRNPLSPIVTALQLMKLRGDTASTREQAVIQRQVDHLLRLVDDLLDVARITRGKIVLKKVRVDVADVIASAVEMASDLFEQRRQHLRIDTGPPGLQCDADPTRLAQALSNLLTNAARYTPEGGQVSLVASRELAGIMIRVTDDGIGIDAALLPRVFDLFVQGGRGLDRAEGGLGIGLALVRNLVELHGGEVGASSAGPGLGSEFTVLLPAVLADADPSAPAQAPLFALGVQQPAGRRVMVVDDNVDAADTLAEALRMMGHEVVVYHAPLDVLEQPAALQSLDAAILDIGLPGMSGYELAARLRQAQPGAGCMFIALTGYGQAEDRARSSAAGFDAHMVKPVDLQALDRLIAGGLAA